MSVIGYASAGLIATGVVIPLGVGAASITNFVGYVAWCLWLIAMAVVLWAGSVSLTKETVKLGLSRTQAEG